MTVSSSKIQLDFDHIASLSPTNEDEYNQLVELLNEMIDIIRDNERHPLANLMDVLGVLSERFKVPASVFI